MTRTLPWLLCLLLSGCSALGLTEGLEQSGGCGDCAELNELEPPGPCMSWECSDRENPDDGVCELNLFDGDDDGAPIMECALDDRVGDCDDLDPANTPTGLEVCDGQDNDCDGLVDEEIPFTTTVLATGMFSGVSWTLGPAGVTGAYFDDRRFLSIVSQGTARVIDSSMRPNPRSVLGTAGPDIAVGVLQSLCPSYLAGVWVAGESMLTVAASQEMDGVTSTLSCADPTSRVESAAIVGRGPSVLVTVLVHADATGDSCGTATGGTVAAAVLRRDAGGPPEQVGAATAIGTHTGLGEPALLDLESLGVLLAVVGDDAIELHQLTLDFTAASPLLDDLVLEIPCEGACGHLSLAALESEPGVVGLAFRDGRCSEPVVRLIRVRVGPDSVSAIDASPVLVGAGDIRRVSVASRAASPAWVVAWADGQSLRARRVGEQAIGVPLEVRTSAGFFVEPLLVSYDQDGIEVYAFDANAGELVAMRAACGAPERN